MKNEEKPKDLGGGKWLFDITYSHCQSNSSNVKKVAFTNSHSAAVKQKVEMQSQIASLERIIETQRTQLLELKQKESQLLLFSDNDNKLPKMQHKIKKQIKRIGYLQKELQSLKQQLLSSAKELPSKNMPRSVPVHKDIHTNPSPLPHSIPHYPHISVGDRLFHKEAGNGIVFSTSTLTFKVYFENKMIRAFTFHDSAFDQKTLSLKNHWNSYQRAYAPKITPDSFSVSIESKNDYTQFLSVQNNRLKESISILRSVCDTYTQTYHAQCALETIFNIEHSRDTFPKFQALRTSIVSKKQSQPQEEASSFSPLPASFSIQFKPSTDALYVYSGRIKCIREKHTMVCANARIETVSGKTAILNVNCCLNCNRFFISQNEYSHYMEKYKSLLARIVFVDENSNSDFSGSLAVESALKLCGYTVSQEKGFTSQERAALLASIIHHGIVSKPDVIQHLSWLIHMNGKKAGNSIAKEKWEEDLAFVRELDASIQATHTVRAIVPYSSNKK